MKNRRIAALFAAAVLIITFASCSKEEAEHEEPPKENIVVIEPADPKPEEDIPEEIPQKEPEEQQTSSEPEEIPPEEPVEPEEPPEPEEPEIPMPEDESLLILVNPWNYIPEDYTFETETVQGKYKMNVKAAESAKAFVAAAKEAGFNMQLCSAYRTVEKSAELYQRKVNQYLGYGYSEADAKTEAAKWVAPPGTSEHHTGLAMDLVSSDYWNYYSDLEHDYEKFDSFKWMYEHCAEYGFILRYPKDKQDVTGITYEPWHYRFVGKEAAGYIMENGLCLEEYLEIIK
ncbi:MAG: M15 family metallopeptidase [Oscillospiraceae bacterium]|nr:M15 family metallopeptidase [Oscillospiraceae bacterium]